MGGHQLFSKSKYNYLVFVFVFKRWFYWSYRNKEGQKALEWANEYLKMWEEEMKTKKTQFKKFKSELNNWKRKIFYALAK